MLSIDQLILLTQVQKAYEREQQIAAAFVEKQLLDGIEFTLTILDAEIEKEKLRYEERRKKRNNVLIGDRFDDDFHRPEIKYIQHIERFEVTHNVYHARRARRLEKLIGFIWTGIPENDE